MNARDRRPQPREGATDPGHRLPDPDYRPSGPGYRPPDLDHRPPGPGYRAPDPGYRPSDPGYRPSDPGYRPSGPGYRPPDLDHRPPGPGYRAPDPGYRPSDPGYRPPGPGHRPTDPGYRPSDPGYRPPGPGRRPPDPGYRPSAPGRRPPDLDHRPPGPGQGRTETATADPLRAAHAHCQALQDALVSLREHGLEQVAQWGRHLAATLPVGGRLLAAGNGGSAAQAQHLTAELVGRYQRERPAYSAIALHADTSSLTAIGNDYGFEELYARQVAAHGRPGDVLLLMSTSGRSPNLLAAADTGRAAGLRVWAMTGPRPNPLAFRADEALCIGSGSTATVQESHLVALHLLCETFDHESRASEDAPLDGAGAGDGAVDGALDGAVDAPPAGPVVPVDGPVVPVDGAAVPVDGAAVPYPYPSPSRSQAAPTSPSTDRPADHPPPDRPPPDRPFP